MKKTLIALFAASVALPFGAAQAAKHEMPAASDKGQQQKAENMQKKEAKKEQKAEKKADKKTETKGDEKAKK